MNYPVIFPGLWVRRKKLVSLVLSTLILCGNSLLFSSEKSSSEKPPSPPLLIPIGSYLANENIALVRGSEKQVYRLPCEELLTFMPRDGIPDPESCWSQGYDLAEGKTTNLICDTSVRLEPEKGNAARFFHSALLPYGSYVHSCTGILRTREGGRKYLYASCLSSQNRAYYNPGKLDITNCNNEIINNNGELKCSNAPVKPWHILKGSYLKLFEFSDVVYDPGTDTLQAVYHNPDSKKAFTFTLDNASSCIGAGKDIVTGTSPGPHLKCTDSEDKSVTLHTSSQTLPAGSYPISCRKILFFPCIGKFGRGVLSAECQNSEGKFISAILEDRGRKCRMSDMGYVNNIGGQLTCDPNIRFNDEDPTDGSALQDNLRCQQKP